MPSGNSCGMLSRITLNLKEKIIVMYSTVWNHKISHLNFKCICQQKQQQQYGNFPHVIRFFSEHIPKRASHIRKGGPLWARPDCYSIVTTHTGAEIPSKTNLNTYCRFLDAIASPTSYPCQWVSESFRRELSRLLPSLNFTGKMETKETIKECLN